MPATRTDRIEGVLTSTAIKPPCRVVATSNIPFVGSAPYGLLTINGIALSDNAGTDAPPDRALLIAQTDRRQNGIWQVSTLSWTRALDFDGARDAVQGTVVIVYNDVTGQQLYQLMTANPVIFGTSDLVFQAIPLGAPGTVMGLGDRTLDASSDPGLKSVADTDHLGIVWVDGAAGAFDVTFLPSTLPGMECTFRRKDSADNINTIRIIGQSGPPKAQLTADGDWARLKSHASGTALILISSGSPQ